MADSRIDVLRELRLRNWARTHYVPLHERKATWHPIVLDEMLCRDKELEDLAEFALPASRYVPLAPTERLNRHPAHEAVPDPKLIRRASGSELRRASETLR